MGSSKSLIPRLLASLAVGASSFLPTFGEEVTARQVIIRAPELRVLEAALANSSDTALANLLRNWVKEGNAQVVSEVSASGPPEMRLKAHSGRLFDWVTEIEQDFGFETGLAALIPKDTEKVFIGSSMEAAVERFPDAGPQSPVGVAWAASFSPRDEKTVPWPVWWPATKKPPRMNWYQQKDFFVENVITNPVFTGTGSAILAMVRPADDLEPDAKAPAMLDVIMAELTPKEHAPAFQREKPDSSSSGRCTMLGFGMPDADALEVLSGRATHDESALLELLLKKLAAGDAKLRLVSSVATRQGQRCTVGSVREHCYPTEMPTIPSAWQMRPVGTRLEIDRVNTHLNLALDFHPALPRRAEWRCALETPDLFMWLPQFFVRNLRTFVEFGDDGIALLGVMRTPDCQTSAKGILPGETLVVVLKLDGVDLGGAKAALVELEAIVFDVPAAEASTWKSATLGTGDDERFRTLVERTKRGDAKLAAHVLVSTTPGHISYLNAIEEVMTVTEVDPPERESPTRYRPTAMDLIPCGTTWTVDTQLRRPVDPIEALGPLEVVVKHTLRHHVAPPLEPSHERMIAESRISPTGDIPKAVIFEETWDGETILVPGKARFIGMRSPPGETLKDRVHLAFLRVRVTEAREAGPGQTPEDPFAPAGVRK